MERGCPSQLQLPVCEGRRTAANAQSSGSCGCALNARRMSGFWEAAISPEVSCSGTHNQLRRGPPDLGSGPLPKGHDCANGLSAALVQPQRLHEQLGPDRSNLHVLLTDLSERVSLARRALACLGSQVRQP